MSKRIDLIQPRHTYAPPVEEGQWGHIYMPNALYTRAAALMAAGVEVTIHDENLRPAKIASPLVGISLVGAPYIPVVRELQRSIRAEIGSEARFLLGGQVVSASALRPSEFEQLFGLDAVNGNEDVATAELLGIDPRTITAKEHTSLVPVYEMISDEDMRLYLTHEFCLYLSQGCSYGCDFCAAHHTDTSPEGRGKVKEEYRDMEILEKDLEYLIVRAKHLGIRQLSFYLSNLDLFQTPYKLFEFARRVQGLRKKYPDFGVIMRGLSTVSSFIKTTSKQPYVIEAMIDAGLTAVGFGVDGITASTRKVVQKGFYSEDDCLQAIDMLKGRWNITPEVLMVIGIISTEGKIIDTAESLKASVDFTKAMIDEYEAIPRPHAARSFIPGNKGWRHLVNSGRTRLLLSNQILFQSLDFTALPTLLTHRDPQFVQLVREAYLQMCALPGNTTPVIQPITSDMDEKEIAAVKEQNKGKFDR